MHQALGIRLQFLLKTATQANQKQTLQRLVPTKPCQHASGDPEQQSSNTRGSLPRTAHHRQTLLAKVLSWLRALRTAQSLLWEGSLRSPSSLEFFPVYLGRLAQQPKGTAGPTAFK